MSNDSKIASLKSDPNVLSFSPRLIKCRCTITITLPRDYWMHNWNLHVKRCELRNRAERGLQAITTFFQPTTAQSKSPEKASTALPKTLGMAKPSTKRSTLPSRSAIPRCLGLNTEPWVSLAEANPDDHFGGISPAQYPELCKRLCPYKDWPDASQPRCPVLEGCNREPNQGNFTETEMDELTRELRSLAVWIIDGSVVRSMIC